MFSNGKEAEFAGVPLSLKSWPKVTGLCSKEQRPELREFSRKGDRGGVELKGDGGQPGVGEKWPKDYFIHSLWLGAPGQQKGAFHCLVGCESDHHPGWPHVVLLLPE